MKGGSSYRCPSRAVIVTERLPRYRCRGRRDHAGDHHAPAGRVTVRWSEPFGRLPEPAR